jgi:hypothetical protein
LTNTATGLELSIMLARLRSELKLQAGRAGPEAEELAENESGLTLDLASPAFRIVAA